MGTGVTHIQSYHSPPLFWIRYIDDVCAAVPEDHIQEFKDHINAVEPLIIFTMELESDSKISFLDIEIQHHENGTLATKVFRKKTHTDQYLSFCSHHPTEHKFAVARTLFNRAEVICSVKDDNLEEEDRHITSALMSNGYPHSFIQGVLRKSKRSRSDEQPFATVVLPYVKNVSENIRRILSPLNVITCFKPHKTLRNILVHAKGREHMNTKKLERFTKYHVAHAMRYILDRLGVL